MSDPKKLTILGVLLLLVGLLIGFGIGSVVMISPKLSTTTIVKQETFTHTIIQTMTLTKTSSLTKTETITKTVTPEKVPPPSPSPLPPPEEFKEVKVISTGSTYKAVSQKPSGDFVTGQPADIVLSWFGFNNSGGPLVFNHPMGIASDGKHLLLADTRNNRILIWNELPTSNKPPDIVLGQPDFYSNEPGTSKSKLRWPVSVATDGKRVIVADTYNNRILIWNEFPTRNGEPADIVLGQDTFNEYKPSLISWPWSVWTDGEKLAVTSTKGRAVLIWKQFPTRNNQPPDLILSIEEFGTPRNIESDGKTYFLIGDHNAKGTGRGGTFIWFKFPDEENEKYDLYLGGEVLWCSEVIGGDLFGIANNRPMIIHDFKSLKGDLDLMELERKGIATAFNIFLEDGDGSGAVFVDNGTYQITYVSLYNGGRIVGYFGKPKNKEPDFVIGSDDIMMNPFTDKYFFTDGGKPVSNGDSLIVLNGYNRRIAVWRKLPDESGALPDIVYELDFEPISGEFYNGKFYVTGRGGDGGGLAVWGSEGLLNGEQPEVLIMREFAGIDLREARDISFDSEYVYLLAQEVIYLFKQPFDLDSKPIKQISHECGFVAISSNGDKLAAVTACSEVLLFDVEAILSDNPKYIRLRGFNLPEDVFISKSKLFVADTCFNRILIWNSIPQRDDERPDIVIGQNSFEEWLPPKYTKDGLFWPGGVWYDGHFLWVGEFKFSNRILRFSPQAP